MTQPGCLQYYDNGLMNLQESQYVPFGPSAGEGWQTDMGDAMTDTTINIKHEPIMGDTMSDNTFNIKHEQQIRALFKLG